ncbi:response regulator [Phytoactinopolyspora mesophila]|uniref:Response regulator n=1 Tax=Phytoactinopolyspora mesophila TaxID=2650750 RepID=A0A7K3M3P5_9ACTN|nr:response regulator transcription factor [Phytoactinopolyspora mesophila]NDL57951.1 response regulator [Phytoactinopolyspora mesophila]
MTEPPTDPVSVLLVDDDPLVRAGLRLMLGGSGDIEIVGEVGDGTEVADAVSRHRPDVILMDIRMPYLDGISATRMLTSRRPAADHHRQPVVIVLTTFDADTNVIAALRAGAAGFLLKNTPPDQIVEAVRRAATGEPVLSPTAVRSLIDHVATTGADERSRQARDRFALLAVREREVAVAVAEGLSNAEIAERLYMSVGTVKAHVSSILTKLGLTNRIQLAILAHDAGLD